MTRTYDHFPCRRTALDVSSPESLRLPCDLFRIAKIAIRGLTPQNCTHALDLRDRLRDGGSTNKYWLQQDPVSHRCAAKYLLPIAAAVLSEQYPNNRIEDLEGTLTMTRDHAPIPEIATLLVRELAPYLFVNRVDIYHYARSDFRGQRFDHDGNPV